MIPRTVPSVQIESWQEQLAHTITDPHALLNELNLSPEQLPDLLTDSPFSLRVPKAYLQRMQPEDPNDPLLRQILPIKAEQAITPGYSTDPLAETSASPAPGLIHKYHGRLLLIVSSACAINCRFCFRRHFPYSENRLTQHQVQHALRYIEQDSSIEEVILSGGDPLSTSDTRLSELVNALASVPHLKRLRIHSRLPIVLPDRITQDLIDALTQSRLKPVFVIHCNHPNEIDAGAHQALQKLQVAGITVLNQSVLLSGINDDVTTLKALHEKLFSSGVLPYYLHLLDPVAGAAHFNVSQNKAQQLIDQLALCSPGYLVPKLARELPGILAKQTYSPVLTAPSNP